MNGARSKPNYGAAVRLVAVLACGLGPSMAWSPWAQAAGNVQASVANGDLIISGDSRNNNIIVIQEFAAGQVRVIGRAGTTVNGERGIFAEGVTNDIDIAMRGGDDFVRVEVIPGANPIPGDLRINTGRQDDVVELLGVTVSAETQINTGSGNDIIFIDGVFSHTEAFVRSDFTGRFAVEAGDEEDLLEMNHATFRGEVDVNLGNGIDAACSHASEFQDLDNTSFDGGAPHAFPGDGFYELVIDLADAIVDFEEFPDDCAFLGGRVF
jgi:hypothetical protein